jgi:hypothetical protein
MGKGWDGGAKFVGYIELTLNKVFTWIYDISNPPVPLLKGRYKAQYSCPFLLDEGRSG